MGISMYMKIIIIKINNEPWDMGSSQYVSLAWSLIHVLFSLIILLMNSKWDTTRNTIGRQLESVQTQKV